MKLPQILIAAVSGLALTACASKPFTAPMVIQRPVPLECQQSCPEPAPLYLHRQAWEAETLARFLQCKELHDDCVEALSK